MRKRIATFVALSVVALALIWWRLAPVSPTVSLLPTAKIAIAPVATSPVLSKPRAVADEPPTVTGPSPAELALAQFEAIADLPGARALALDIRHALEDDPNAIDFSAITEGPDHTLRADYLERMIPDSELRDKWIRLMAIVASRS